MYTGELVSDFAERFAELVDEKTKAKEINESVIARDLGVSKQTISAWKSGKRSPKKPTLITVADYFGVSLAWLNGFDVDKFDKEGEKIMLIPQTENGIWAGLLVDTLTLEEQARAIDLLKVVFSKSNKAE